MQYGTNGAEGFGMKTNKERVLQELARIGVGYEFKVSRIAGRLGIAHEKARKAIHGLSESGAVEKVGFSTWRVVSISSDEQPSGPPRWDVPQDVPTGARMVDLALASRPLLVLAFDAAVSGWGAE